MMRLNKYLAECGVGSRRHCDDLIASGRVSVNGHVVEQLGIKIDETHDTVHVDGKLRQRPSGLQYIMLNKPKGVVTTASDEFARRTVLDLVQSDKRLFPVGRLDKDSTGLLLLTNDGELTYRLSHPKYEIEKVYEVRLAAELKPSDQRRLQTGVKLQEGKTAPCEVRFPTPGDRRLMRITMHQGWKRQIRRMLSELGYEVLELHRIRIGSLQLNGLEAGAARPLNEAEISGLKKQVGL